MSTSNMGWTEPTIGSSSDVWGNLINATFDNQDAHLAGLIYGLTLSAAGSTATFGIAAGAASGMVLASAFTKTTSLWGVGTGQGALDTGAIANSTWYHVWLIQRSDTLVVDVLVSLSATTPTMPTSYDRKRRIGAMKTDGSAQWVKFTQFKDLFLWDVPVNDIASTSIPTTVTNYTLSVPTGVNVIARTVNRAIFGSSSDTIRFFSPSLSDAAMGPGNLTNYAAAAGDSSTVGLDILTNTSAQICGRSFIANASVIFSTQGWIDYRGNV